MQAQDFFKSADGFELKPGDTVWVAGYHYPADPTTSLMMPYKLLKIISQKEYRKIEARKHLERTKEWKDHHKEIHTDHLAFKESWKKSTGNDWAETDSRWDDDFDIYWGRILENIKKDDGPKEFPENKIPMGYIARFKGDDTNESWGTWSEIIKLFKDPTKVPQLNTV